MKQRNDIRPKLMLVASMVIYGTIGIFRRNVPVTSSFLAMSRGLTGMLFLLAAGALLKRGKSGVKEGESNTVDHADAHTVRFMISGVLIGINWILLFEAYNYTSVAVATLCYYMAPVFVILASPFVLDERITLKRALCVLTAFIGMVLVSDVGGSGTGSNDLKGILFGLGAALLYASVILINKKTESGDALRRTVIQLGSAGMALLPYVMITGAFPAEKLSLYSMFLILVMGLVHTGLAYLLYFRSLKDLPVQTAAIYSYIDPAVAILLSAFLLKEGMTLKGFAGAVMILGSAILTEF